MSALLRVLGASAVLALALLMPSEAAQADEPGQSDEAKVLVLQAIALVVNTPHDAMAIEERIHDALEAPDTEGVDLDLVEQAATALSAGDLRRTRDLLQTSIGAGPYLGNGVPKPIREDSGQPGKPASAVGGQAGTTVVLDAYRPPTALDGGDVVLVVLAAAAILAGGLLSWRLRPADTVRQLRRAGTATPADGSGEA